MKERVLLTGASGHIGRYLLAAAPDGYEIFAVRGSSPPPAGVPGARCDLADAAALNELLGRVQPQHILHTAAIATVEDCEKNRALAEAVNVGATQTLARWAEKNRARLLYTSTDLVFDGKIGPYAPDAEPAPLSFYGATKWRGEQVVRGIGAKGCVVRCAINYGWDPPGHAHYAEQLVRGLRAGGKQRLFTDQFRSFIHTADTAAGLWRLLAAGATGTWHLGGPEVISRYDFARLVARQLGVSSELLQATRMSDLNDFLPRPQNCGFSIRPLPPDDFVPAPPAMGIARWLADREQPAL